MEIYDLSYLRGKYDCNKNTHMTRLVLIHNVCIGRWTFQILFKSISGELQFLCQIKDFEDEFDFMFSNIFLFRKLGTVQ